MTKTLTAAMKAHIAGTVTSLASCWKITRVDGKVFTFTSHDRDLVIDGLTYQAESSFDRSAVESDPTMSVDNLEVQGIFDSAALRADELRAGVFDKAGIELFMVNWADLSMGKIKLRRGWLGEVTLTPSGIFKSEIRGLVQALQQNVGEFYTTQCRADLGDSRCKVPVNPPLITRGLPVRVFDYYRKADTGVTDDGSSVVYHDVIFQVVAAGTTSATDVAYNFAEGSETVDGGATLLAVAAWSRYGVVAGDSADNQNFNATWPYGADPRILAGDGPAARPGAAATTSNAGVLPSPETWFNDGILTWETGLNIGLSMEIQFSVGCVVTAAGVYNGGSGGVDGVATMTGTTGTGNRFTATGDVVGGVLQNPITITFVGNYSVPPTGPDPVTGGPPGASLSFTTGTAFALHLPMGFPLYAGDRFRVYAGCSKLVGVKPAAIQSTSVYGTFSGTSLTVVDPDGCFPKFRNAVNYRGEPFIPGVDFLVGAAGFAKSGYSTSSNKK